MVVDIGIVIRIGVLKFELTVDSELVATNDVKAVSFDGDVLGAIDEDWVVNVVIF